MKLDKLTKALLILIGVGMIVTTLKDRFFKTGKNEIVVAGHHVDKQPWLFAMNELFGRSVDSSKLCNCLIPHFYELIKNDPSSMKKFEEMGFFKLEGALNDSAQSLLANCVRQNIIDTSFRIDMEKFKGPFLKRLKDSLEHCPEFRTFNQDSLANCFFQSLKGNITIKEFFSEDYLKIQKLKVAMTNCLVKPSSLTRF